MLCHVSLRQYLTQVPLELISYNISSVLDEPQTLMQFFAQAMVQQLNTKPMTPLSFKFLYNQIFTSQKAN